MRTIHKSLFVLAAMLISLNSVKAQDGDTLRDTLSSEQCQSACLWGLEPDVTTQAEIESVLQTEHIEYEIVAMGIDPNPETADTLQYVVHARGVSPFIDGERETVFFVGRDGPVGPITIPLVDTTVDMVLDWYGAPVSIVDTGGGYALVYPTEGLVFVLSGMNGNSTAIHSVMLNSEMGITRGYLERLQNIQPCTEPAILCSIQIAVVPTITYAPSWRDCVAYFLQLIKMLLP